MKERLRKSFKGGLRLLTLTLGSGEHLDYVRSEWLAEGPGEGLLPFRYQGCEKGATLNYDVLGLVQLPQFVKAPLSSAQYESLLRQLCSVVALCVSQDVPTSGLWFDPEGVFVTPEGRLRFVLVPVSGYVKAQHSTPLELIGWLGSSAHVSMAVGESHRHVSAVGDWARRQSVFSPQKFGRFLDGEYERTPVPGPGAGPGSPGPSTLSDSSPLGRGCHDCVEAAKSGRGQRAAQGRDGATLDPLDLFGVNAQGRAPRPMARRISRTTYEVVPHEVERPSVSGDTLSLGSGSLGTRQDAMRPVPAADNGVPAIASPPAVSVRRLRDGLRLQVPGQPAVLGRSETCDLHFGGNLGMSRRHLEVSPDADGLTIRDLGSSNGTYVAGSRLAPQGSVHVDRGGHFTVAGDDFLVE